MGGFGWLAKETQALLDIQLLYKFDGDTIKTEDFIAFTSCIIVILSTSRPESSLACADLAGLRKLPSSHGYLTTV